MIKLRALTRSKMSDFKVRHYIYKCPCLKLHTAIKRRASAVRRYTQEEIARYVRRGGLTGCLNGKGVSGRQAEG